MYFIFNFGISFNVIKRNRYCSASKLRSYSIKLLFGKILADLVNQMAVKINLFLELGGMFFIFHPCSCFILQVLCFNLHRFALAKNPFNGCVNFSKSFKLNSTLWV